MVFFRPSLSGVEGEKPISFLARLISGQRCVGSSSGKSWNMMDEDEPVNSITKLANSAMVVSIGLPMFIGPVTSSGRAIN